jgi:hypothetical protein
MTTDNHIFRGSLQKMKITTAIFCRGLVFWCLPDANPEAKKRGK